MPPQAEEEDDRNETSDHLTRERMLAWGYGCSFGNRRRGAAWLLALHPDQRRHAPQPGRARADPPPSPAAGSPGAAAPEARP